MLAALLAVYRRLLIIMGSEKTMSTQPVSKLVCKPCKSHQGGISPGQILQRARISKGMTPEEVASSLHLSVRWIEDIEKDQFAYAPAVTYIRGYLRAYARLLAVQVDTVLDAFDAMGWHALAPVVAPAPVALPNKWQILCTKLWSWLKQGYFLKKYCLSCTRKHVVMLSAGVAIILLACVGHHYIQKMRAHKVAPGVLVAIDQPQHKNTHTSTESAGPVRRLSHSHHV